MRTRRHALGQNFLHHQPTIQKIANLVNEEMHKSPEPPRSLLEIGPGKLALTKVLAPLADQHRIPLVLVERDRYLEETIHEGGFKSDIHFMDAATERFTELLDQLDSEKRTPIFVASNLPYSASSQILALLCHRSHLLSGCVVMVQKELAKRIVAKPGGGDRGALSLLIQSYFQTETAFDVGPGAFSPPPKVMSTVLKMRPLEESLTRDLADPLLFERFCKQLFSQRRKMIRNLIPAEKHQLFPKLGISGTERPETLALSIVLELFRISQEPEEHV